MMKEYNRFMKEVVGRDARFQVFKNGKKPTIKIKHVGTGQIYSVHPGDNAVVPVGKWMKKFD